MSEARAGFSQQMASFDRNRLNFSWLLTLRWSSIAGQLATILGVHLALGVEVDLAALLSIVGIEAVSNLACVLWFRRDPVVAQWHLAAVMALDVALLTGLLYFTGGPFNPFSFLYLVQIALSTVVLHAQWTWMLVAWSLGAFGLLLVEHRDLPLSGDAHQKGMWVALGVASGFIVHFLRRVTGALAERERELFEVRHQAAQKERLASLATMAAGAAHELATPLGTIALVAKELERHMQGASAEQIEDVQLIRQQVARCRRILDQMRSSAGETAGEPLDSVSLGALLKEAMIDLRPTPAVHLDLPDTQAEALLRLPPRAVAQALHSVITNAQDASPTNQPVEISAQITAEQVEILVRDHGRGMAPDIAARAGEPFFTTKAPGQGMGLGLFLTRAVVEKIGGRVVIESNPGAGTRVRLTLPTRSEILGAEIAAGDPGPSTS